MSRINEDQFVKTNFEMLNNKEFIIKNRSKYMLYLIIRKFAVRKPFKGDLGLHKNFWEKGYIASSKAISSLSDIFGHKSGSTIRRWINELVNEKAIVLSKVSVNPGKPQNVFILGIHNAGKEKDYKEYFYIDWPELIDEFGVSGMVDFYKLLKKSSSNC